MGVTVNVNVFILAVSARVCLQYPFPSVCHTFSISPPSLFSSALRLAFSAAIPFSPLSCMPQF